MSIFFIYFFPSSHSHLHPRSSKSGNDKELSERWWLWAGWKYHIFGYETPQNEDDLVCTLGRLPLDGDLPVDCKGSGDTVYHEELK